MEKIEYYHKNSEALAYKKVISSDGDWNEATYNKEGKELTYKDSNGFWAERTFDENGNLLTYKNSKDYWEERTRDKNGNMLTYKDSNGFWAERTYNNKGMELTYKNSDGYWSEKIYDENGNMLIFKDSDNYWYEKTYDENGNRLTFKSSDDHYKIKDREVTKEEFEYFQSKLCLGKADTIDKHVKTINSLELASDLAHNAMLDEMGVSIDEWEEDESVVSFTNGSGGYTEEAQDIFNRWYYYFLTHIDTATI